LKKISFLVGVMLLFNCTFAASFSDISGHWAENFINQATEKKYFSGYPDGTFLPQNSITRMEFIIICNKFINQNSKIEGLKTDKVYVYSDVEAVEWALPLYKEFMAKVNLFGSKSDDNHGEMEIKQIFGENFEPSKPITREEAVAIFNIFIDEKNRATDIGSFPDIESATFPRSISTASNLGIVNGYTDGTFKPFGLITRAEASAMLLNFEKAKDAIQFIIYLG